MAKRIITAAIGVPFALVILYLGGLSPHVLAVATDIVSVMAVYEVISAAKYTRYRSITILSLMFSAMLPLFFCYGELRPFAVPVAFLFLILLFSFTLMRHKEIKFEELGFIAFVSICIPLAISSLAFFCFQWED